MDEESSASSVAHLADRAKKAARIVRHPERYKICEGCDSIVAQRVPTCPNCYGYRFNEERQAVVGQARLLGSRAQTSVAAEDMA